MVYTLERHQSVDILITARKFIDSEGTVIAPSEPLYCELENNNVINGTLLLQYSINENKNLFGNLSTLWLLLSMHKKSP